MITKMINISVGSNKCYEKSEINKSMGVAGVDVKLLRLISIRVVDVLK